MEKENEVVVEETEEVVEEPKEEKKAKKKSKNDGIDEEFVDKKEKKMISKIINVVLWIILIVWIGVCVLDFINTKNGKAPKFCISKKTTTYSDGTVDICTGAGYKVYHYQRDAINAIEFGPLWGKERLSDLK